MMKVAILDQTTAGWSAGASYTSMMLRSLALVSAGDVELFFLSRNSGIEIPESFTRIPIAENVTKEEWAGLKAQWQLDVLIPARDYSVNFGVTPAVGWIPDFQQLWMPELFNEEELIFREKLTRFLIGRCRGLFFSSEAVRAEFKSFYSDASIATTVASFASVLWSESLSENPQLTVKKYHLPDRYVMVTNQFWKHKNHAVIPPALAATSEPVPIVLCGMPSDYRDPKNQHLSAFFQESAKFGVSNRIFNLGHLGFSEMLDLMRCSSAVLQPSRSEGWNTSVEDAKALGKPLICSDLPVHREQAAGADFFEWNDPQRLGSILDSHWNQSASGFEAEKERAALDQARLRSAKFGEKILGSARAAVETEKNHQNAASVASGWKATLKRQVAGWMEGKY